MPRRPAVPGPGGAPDDPADPLTVLPGGWSRETTLRDGTRVLLRQIRPDDRAALAEGLQRLSPASRYLRFRASIDRLSEAQLDYLTDVDHHDHEAIVAIDLDRDEPHGVGVARYVREPFEPRVAETAVTVADDYHGRGVGTVLLGALAARARAEDVAVFRSYVLDGNRGMLEVFDHLGAQRELDADGLWRVDLDVPDEAPEEEPASTSGAERAFLDVARDPQGLAGLIAAVRRRARRPDDDRPDPADGATLHDELERLEDELDDWLQRRDDR